MRRCRKLVGALTAVTTFGVGMQVVALPAMAAQTLYVDAVGGSDANSCTSAAEPCATIGAAVTKASPGDTIEVSAGEYPERVNVTKPLVFHGPNSLVPATGDRSPEAVVESFYSTFGDTGVRPGASQSRPVTVSGFTIDPQGDPFFFNANNKHLVNLFGSPNGVNITNNIFRGGDEFNPDCDPGTGCDDMVTEALLIQSGKANINNNSFENFTKAVQMFSNDHGAPLVFHSIDISDNTFTNFSVSGVTLWSDRGAGAPVDPMYWPGANVVGNTFHDAPGVGVNITTGDNLIANNTFSNLGSGVYLESCGWYWAPGAGTNSVIGNVFSDNGYGIQSDVFWIGFCTPENGGTVAHVTATDNQFVGNTEQGIGWTDYGDPWDDNGGSNPTPYDIDATCNWWNDLAGPNHSGDGVSVGVDATPWLSSPNGECTDKPAVVSGTVTGVDGNPVAGVAVRIFDEGGVRAAWTTTDGSGHYVLPAVYEGNYKVRFISGDAAYGTTWNDGASTMATAPWVEAVAGTTTVDVALRQVVTLSGTVTDVDTHDGLATGRVVLRAPSTLSPNLAASFTDASGHYAIVGVPAGTYSAFSKADGYRTQWYDGSENAAGASTLDLTTAGVHNVDFKLTARP